VGFTISVNLSFLLCEKSNSKKNQDSEEASSVVSQRGYQETSRVSALCSNGAVAKPLKNKRMHHADGARDQPQRISLSITSSEIRLDASFTPFAVR